MSIHLLCDIMKCKYSIFIWKFKIVYRSIADIMTKWLTSQIVMRCLMLTTCQCQAANILLQASIKYRIDHESDFKIFFEQNLFISSYFFVSHEHQSLILESKYFGKTKRSYDLHSRPYDLIVENDIYHMVHVKKIYVQISFPVHWRSINK